MKTVLVLVMVSLPCAAGAGSDCQVVEYGDHYEVSCVETRGPTVDLPAAAAQDTAPQAAPALPAGAQGDPEATAEAAEPGASIVSTGRSFGAYRPRSGKR